LENNARFVINSTTVDECFAKHVYPPGTSKRVSNNLIFLRKKGIDQSCNLTLRNNENQTYNNNNDEEVKQESHLLKCLNILFGTLKPTLHKEFSLELMQVFN